MRDIVECRSDQEYAGQPRALYWQEHRLDVVTILASWRTPTGKHFRVQTQDEQVFELYYLQHLDTWQIKQL